MHHTRSKQVSYTIDFCMCSNTHTPDFSPFLCDVMATQIRVEATKR